MLPLVNTTIITIIVDVILLLQVFIYFITQESDLTLNDKV